MIPVLSRAEARALDRLATSEHGIPSHVLMENAGRAATSVILEELPGAERFAVVVGAGNNGGDGLVVARELALRGRTVKVLLVADPDRLSGDALGQYRAWTAAGGAVERVDPSDLDACSRALAESDLVVDALFGTGLARALEGLERAVVERMNQAPVPRVALDLPSGLDADRGVPLGVALRAELTVTFAGLKRGLMTPEGAELSGRVRVVDIGIPQAALDRVGFGASVLEESQVASGISPRDRRSHKGTSGRVLIVAGSPGKVGAALLVAHGALRAGAGLVTIASVPDVARALESRVLEAMTARLDPAAPEASLAPLLERADAVVIGPGLGFEDPAARIVRAVVLGFAGRVVVDADAITHFEGRAGELAGAKGRLLLTPHPGELGRLLGIPTADVESDRFGAVERAVSLSAACVLLKGAPTLIGAPGERIGVCTAGHPILATGGSGDVLSGCLGALLKDNDPYRAASTGAFLLGRAAERLAAARGVDRGVLAHEVADEVPAVLAGLSRQRPFVSR